MFGELIILWKKEVCEDLKYIKTDETVDIGVINLLGTFRAK